MSHHGGILSSLWEADEGRLLRVQGRHALESEVLSQVSRNHKGINSTKK